MDQLVATIVAGVVIGALYALIGVGAGSLYRSTGLINLALGELVMVGSLVCYTLSADWGWPLLVAGPTAVVIAALINVVIDVGLIRRMRTPNPLRVAVMTFGVALVLRGLARIKWGTNLYSLPTFPGVNVTYRFIFDRVVVPGQVLYLFGGLLIVCSALYLFETRTRVGWMMHAVGVDSPMARTLGIPAGAMVALSFAISGGIAGLAGVLTSPMVFMTATGATLLGLKGLVAAILGGFDVRRGAVAGGLLLGVVESLAGRYVGAGVQDAAVFLLLILVLLFRPQGLLARRTA